MSNLQRHLDNLQRHFGLECVVAINHFIQDTDAEIELVKSRVESMGARAIVARHWAEGGAGAEMLARTVIEKLESAKQTARLLYADESSLWDKISRVAKDLYRATSIEADAKLKAKIQQFQEEYGHLPVCMAKTPYSFSDDPAHRGAPEAHSLTIRDVRLSRGAGFLVVLCGDVMTMPGLPKRPASERIDIDDAGVISGLF